MVELYQILGGWGIFWGKGILGKTI